MLRHNDRMAMVDHSPVLVVVVGFEICFESVFVSFTCLIETGAQK